MGDDVTFYAGIDEAGYGPVLGPLVVTRCVFRLETTEPTAAPPSLWGVMRSAVCRKCQDKRGRITIGDSKLLYNPSRGLKNLERGVLSFLQASGRRVRNLDGLLHLTAYDESSRDPDGPWYGELRGGPELPLHADVEDISTCTGRLSRAACREGVRLEDVRSAVVFEDRFNSMVETSGSKSTCVWEFVAGHLRDIWNAHAEDRPFVAVDRLGGRKDYRGLLVAALPWADVVLTGTRPGLSEYRLSDGDRVMRVVFRVEMRGGPPSGRTCIDVRQVSSGASHAALPGFLAGSGPGHQVNLWLSTGR